MSLERPNHSDSQAAPVHTEARLHRQFEQRIHTHLNKNPHLWLAVREGTLQWDDLALELDLPLNIQVKKAFDAVVFVTDTPEGRTRGMLKLKITIALRGKLLSLEELAEALGIILMPVTEVASKEQLLLLDLLTDLRDSKVVEIAAKHTGVGPLKYYLLDEANMLMRAGILAQSAGHMTHTLLTIYADEHDLDYRKAYQGRFNQHRSSMYEIGGEEELW